MEGSTSFEISRTDELNTDTDDSSSVSVDVGDDLHEDSRSPSFAEGGDDRALADDRPPVQGIIINWKDKFDLMRLSIFAQESLSVALLHKDEHLQELSNVVLGPFFKLEKFEFQPINLSLIQECENFVQLRDKIKDGSVSLTASGMFKLYVQCNDFVPPKVAVIDIKINSPRLSVGFCSIMMSKLRERRRRLKLIDRELYVGFSPLDESFYLNLLVVDDQRCDVCDTSIIREQDREFIWQEQQVYRIRKFKCLLPPHFFHFEQTSFSVLLYKVSHQLFSLPLYMKKDETLQELLLLGPIEASTGRNIVYSQQELDLKGDQLVFYIKQEPVRGNFSKRLFFFYKLYDITPLHRYDDIDSKTILVFPSDINKNNLDKLKISELCSVSSALVDNLGEPGLSILSVGQQMPEEKVEALLSLIEDTNITVTNKTIIMNFLQRYYYLLASSRLADLSTYDMENIIKLQKSTKYGQIGGLDIVIAEFPDDLVPAGFTSLGREICSKYDNSTLKYFMIKLLHILGISDKKFELITDAQKLPLLKSLRRNMSKFAKIRIGIDCDLSQSMGVIFNTLLEFIPMTSLRDGVFLLVYSCLYQCLATDNWQELAQTKLFDCDDPSLRSLKELINQKQGEVKDRELPAAEIFNISDLRVLFMLIGI